MTTTFLVLGAITVAGTAAAMGLRNAVHCVLALTLGLAGLAALYLQLGAQFLGFTQILVYIGAVAILAVFAIMMTHNPGLVEPSSGSRHWVWGGAVAVAVFAVLAREVHPGMELNQPQVARPEATVRQIGD